MKHRFTSLGCWFTSIVVVFPLYALAYITGYYWIILVAVVLAALDAKRIRVWRYESDIAQDSGWHGSPERGIQVAGDSDS